MKKPLLIEIFIWTSILFIVFSSIIYGYSKVFIEPNLYTIEFKDIDGITKGSPVRLMGVNIGYVKNLKQNDKHINVQIIVTKKDIKLSNGTIARVEFYGLGGSKSIELMPPDGSSCDVGILTTNTIRIDDVMHEAVGLVDVVEEIEAYVNSLNTTGIKNILEKITQLKNDKFTLVDEDIKKAGSKFNKNSKTIQEKEKKIIFSLENANNNIENLNKFIKK